MELINQYGFMIVLVTAVFGFIMAFGIGANDVANAMGTSVGSGTITARQAVYIALVFEFAGAYLAGGEVAETIKPWRRNASFYLLNLLFYRWVTLVVQV